MGPLLRKSPAWRPGRVGVSSPGRLGNPARESEPRLHLLRQPLWVPSLEPGGTADSTLFTAAMFRNAVLRLLMRGVVERVPLILSELRRGDRVRAARALLPAAKSGADETESGRLALTQLIFCYDEYFPGWQAASNSMNALVHPALRTRGTHADCEVWLERLADPSHFKPVRSDIPTLLLAGELDERTPPEFARRIARTLPNAYVYEFPGLGHGLRHPCVRDIVQQFRRDPLKRPDDSCIASMPKVRFETRW